MQVCGRALQELQTDYDQRRQKTLEWHWGALTLESNTASEKINVILFGRDFRFVT